MVTAFNRRVKNFIKTFRVVFGYFGVIGVNSVDDSEVFETTRRMRNGSSALVRLEFEDRQ